MNYKDYSYQSTLASYIESYIKEHRKMGFIYNEKAYRLHQFDTYWRENKFDEKITKEHLDPWLCAKPGESKCNQAARVGAVKGLCIFLNLIGHQVYIPEIQIGDDHHKVHVLSQKELIELFKVIDAYVPKSENAMDHLMADEYPIIYRMLYCCGMRNNEVCSLKTSNIDLESGVITILDGKNHKDRLVYMPEDLRKLTKMYYESMCRRLGYNSEWLFPGRKRDRHIPKGQVCTKFSCFWSQTSFSHGADKNPTPHCLRHTFVVNRINDWIKHGLNLDEMMVYLSKFLGHKSPKESYYYYHLVHEAFDIVHEKDKTADAVIPEVKRR